MEVKLNPLKGFPNSGIRSEEEVPGVWRVDVYDESLKQKPMCIPAGMLHVGIIGKQPQANFCENDSFRRFLSATQRESVIEQVRRLHGEASIEEPVELPEPLEVEDEFDEFGDTDTIED